MHIDSGEHGLALVGGRRFVFLGRGGEEKPWILTMVIMRVRAGVSKWQTYKGEAA